VRPIHLATFQVWHLRLTIHFLADAGNMLDCACLAGIVALRHFRKPEVEVEGDEVTVVSQYRWCVVSLALLNEY
jgi:exosome complex component RRP45